jgi:hypothetical protein
MRVKHWSNFVARSSFSLYPVVKGEITYNQHLDIFFEKKSEHDFQKVDMLVEIYAPELDSKHQEIRVALNKSNKNH